MARRGSSPRPRLEPIKNMKVKITAKTNIVGSKVTDEIEFHDDVTDDEITEICFEHVCQNLIE